ncbi:MAG: helix-hairpin-helix domain-containing protein [Bacteroidales bacterium]|nr:helix-hairpin-helix domain-containing protein [Bacteroidales bacterium]
MRRCVQCVFFLFIAMSVFSQTIPQEERDMLAERIEDLFSDNEEDAQIDLSEIIDAIENLQQNPVYINSSDLEELSRLFFLDEMKIHKIIAYTYTYGSFLSTNELYGIEGLTAEEVDLIIPFISLEKAPVFRKTTVKDVFTRGKQQIIGRYQRVLQEQRGYMDDSIAKSLKYAGDPNKYYLRYRFKYKDQVSFGFTSEKDAGEEFFKGNNPYGFDFYSVHFFINNKNHVLDKLAVGDYHLTFGQGLTMWSTYSFGRPSDGVNIKRSPNGISPSTSANENLFFRGAAATLKFKRHYITGFASYSKRDASISLDDEDMSYFTSFSDDGMHRTANEIAKKNVINQTVVGGRYEWRGYNLRVGATGFSAQWDVPREPDDRPYNLYAFSGKSLSNAGVDFVWIYRKFEVFGEGAYSSQGGFAGIGGVKAHLASRFEASLSVRHYEKDYVNFFSSAFGVNSNNVNETGVFAGFNTIISSKFTLSGYADTYRFPYMKYQIYAPTRGNDYSLQLTYNPNRVVTMYLRYRNTTREYGESSDTIKQTAPRTKNNIRWQGDFTVSKNIVLKTRAEYNHNQRESKENTSGFMMYQDFVYRSSNSRFTTALRYAWFNTDSYDDRFYAYENDLLYTFSVPAYYYKGNRVYLLCSYKITENITAWLRIANTFYSDKNTIGSGGEEIYGNNKTDVKAQIIIKL